ncbi:Long-chain-fatty-acid--CoA ligase FadD15 [Borrelia miyamotoi]|uniref:AMP-binding protein n=1 Tax=Borrelia miyamotoi TaxID=47466 RepID=A0AAP8YV27_9SPIR|nr:AMP-binding protein [Borrelia miyamotoi]AHH05278.1 Long-chain-fatty-acid--CoA ligase [Borrelia miyamotoi FR64b]ATQ15043.1 AMP-binding protein [Borrelia miyamotoi]ATQ16226.1 AMP-binding protein [Borrelia miyamotoi]ATQ17371.1 AMP-binding protein [Borrelia miyamotoi]ATQ18127.1 AMP-binding protein [Borrelia miyamotoi]
MSVVKAFFEIAEKHGSGIAQIYRGSNKEYFRVTYKDLKNNVLKFASFLEKMGLGYQDKVFICSENRVEWSVIDFAILALGAVDVPKGTDVTFFEIEVIINAILPNIVIVENLNLLDLVVQVSFRVNPIIVIIDDLNEKNKERFSNFKIYTYKECLSIGDNTRQDEKIIKILKNVSPDDMATIIYTSGTTGAPKGVMISHANFLYQVSSFSRMVSVTEGQIFMCILPIWHSFQRSFSYNIFLKGMTCLFSSIVPRKMLDDIKNINPHYLAAVPRLWIAVRQNIFKELVKKSFLARLLFEIFVKVACLHDICSRIVLGLYPNNGFDLFMPIKKFLGVLGLVVLFPLRSLGDFLIFKKIRKFLGNNFIVGIAGGSSMSLSVARFFNSIGIKLANAYGLTEASPGVASNEYGKLMLGTCGKILPGTVAEIRDEHGNKLKKPGKGILFIKGPQVMIGYYQDEDATRRVIGADGFLDTGDIVKLSKDNVVQVIGREKDTIVLNNGENIEPMPIEIKLEESLLIEKAVVVGQDQKFLGALILPNFEEVNKYLESIGQKILDAHNKRQIIANNIVLKAINDEIKKLINRTNGFKPFEQVLKFVLLEKPFEIGKEMSVKMDVKRNYILDFYRNEIKNLFS